MLPKRSNVYKTNLSILAVIVMAIVTLLSVFVYRTLIASTFKIDAGATQFCTYHVAMITESHDDPFWKNVWLAAKEEGAQKDACVEWVGSTLAEQYSLASLMEIAIAAKVDGILIQPDGSEQVKGLQLPTISPSLQS